MSLSVQLKELVDELFLGKDFDRQREPGFSAAQDGDAALPEAACQRVKRKTMDIDADGSREEAGSAPSPPAGGAAPAERHSALSALWGCYEPSALTTQGSAQESFQAVISMQWQDCWGSSRGHFDGVLMDSALGEQPTCLQGLRLDVRIAGGTIAAEPPSEGQEPSTPAAAIHNRLQSSVTHFG